MNHVRRCFGDSRESYMSKSFLLTRNINLHLARQGVRLEYVVFPPLPKLSHQWPHVSEARGSNMDSIAVGLHKGHVVSKRKLAARPSQRKGVRLHKS